MTGRDPFLDRILEQIEQDRVLRKRMTALRDPFSRGLEQAAAAAEEMRRLRRYADEYARAQQFAEEAQRWASQQREMQGAFDAVRLAVAATSAFDAIYENIRRVTEVGEAVRRSIDATQLLYEQSRVAALFTSTVQRDLSIANIAPFERLRLELDGVTRAGEAVLERLCVSPERVDALHDWHLQAPTVVPYVGAASLVTFHSANLVLPGDIGPLDSLLDDVGDSIEHRLADVSATLVSPYQGARSALAAAGPDWRRHLGASLRSLVDGLVDALAPDDELLLFFASPDEHRQDGRFTRRAKLTFIFREVAVDGYAQMAENDIEMALATFYPTNAAVHELTSTLTERQGRVLLRRVQGCLMTILATREQIVRRAV